MIREVLIRAILIVCLFGMSSFVLANQAQVESDKATSAVNCIAFAAKVFGQLKGSTEESTKVAIRVVTEISKTPFYNFDKAFLDLFVNLPSNPMVDQILTDFKQFMVLYQFPWLKSEFDFKKMSFEQWKTSFENILDSYNSFVQGEKSKEAVRMGIINTMKSVTNVYGFKGFLMGQFVNMAINMAISRAVENLLSMPIKTKQGRIEVDHCEVSKILFVIEKDFSSAIKLQAKL